jgi:hypothetical protein
MLRPFHLSTRRHTLFGDGVPRGDEESLCNHHGCGALSPPAHAGEGHSAAQVLELQRSGSPETTHKPGTEHVGDDACRSCHQSQFDSYHQTAHHRTSTVPSRDSILGRFTAGENILKPRIRACSSRWTGSRWTARMVFFRLGGGPASAHKFALGAHCRCGQIGRAGPNVPVLERGPALSVASLLLDQAGPGSTAHAIEMARQLRPPYHSSLRGMSRNLR